MGPPYYFPPIVLPRRCVCVCHHAIGTEERYRADGVPITDPIAAATACSKCIGVHCEALLSNADANAPERRVSAEKVAWVDAEPPALPPTQADGEDGG